MFFLFLLIYKTLCREPGGPHYTRVPRGIDVTLGKEALVGPAMPSALCRGERGLCREHLALGKGGDFGSVVDGSVVTETFFFPPARPWRQRR